MNTTATSPETSRTHVLATRILSKNGIDCSLLVLSPGESTPQAEGPSVPEQIIFIVDGEVTVRCDDVNTILGKDEAMHLPKGRAHAISADGGSWAKLLRVEIPPRQVVTPQILTLPNS